MDEYIGLRLGQEKGRLKNREIDREGGGGMRRRERDIGPL